jgi:transposase
VGVDVSCATAVYHVIAPTRGKSVPKEFLGGAKPKMWLSDRLDAQLGHAEEHQFCLAHLIREAQYAIDHGDTIFAPAFKALLQDACEVGRRRPELADATIAGHRRRLERELDRLSHSSRPMPRAASCETRCTSTAPTSCSCS